jgi:secondary thiamine-phosphate synthase enzyme
MQETFQIHTDTREGRYDITGRVRDIVARSGVETGLCSVYVGGATAAMRVQENWDENVQTDVITLLRKLFSSGVWQHDRQDGNGDVHLKAGIVGPSETIPVTGGELGLSTWRNMFLCEFDGPRGKREIVVTVLP